MIVRKLRLRNGWSQEHLAELMGVSTRTIQRIERGQTKPSLETKKSLASVFEVDIATFEPYITKDSTGELDMNKDNITETEQTENLYSDTVTSKPTIEKVSVEEAEAIEYVKCIKEFYTHLLLFVVFSGVFIFTGRWEQMLIAWGGWALGLVIHGLVAFEVINLFKVNWEKKMVEKRLKKKL